MTLPPGSSLVLRRSEQPGLLVRVGNGSFYQRARRKLGLVDPVELGE